MLGGQKNDSLIILQKMQFSEIVVKSKKGIKLESLPPRQGSAWQHSLRVSLQITYWKTLHDTTINPTD